MLRSQALSALFNENLDKTANAIFLCTISGHLIGTSSTSASIPPSLIKKAAVLSTSSFAYYADKLLGSDAEQGSNASDLSNSSASTARPNGSTDSERNPSSRQQDARAISRTNTQRSISTASSGNASSTSGSVAAYLSIQPLPLLARSEWTSSQQPEAPGAEASRLRRIVVAIPIGRFVYDGDEERGKVKAVSRECAVESIGQGLCVGVLGPEKVEIIVSRQSSDTDEEDEDQEEGETMPIEQGLVQSPDRDTQRDEQRRIRLLGIRTEALALFMREEFEGFRMPTLIML